MPTRNVNLTEKLDNFVLARVRSGQYENASEVVRSALRTMERDENEYERKMKALRAAIAHGDSSGFATGDVFGDIRRQLKIRRNKQR
jgi:antitoxin ParD1/3/4